MTDHFTLDVDPEELSSAVKQLSWLSQQLGDEGGKLAGLSGDDQGWTGVAATAVHGEMTTLSAVMTPAAAAKASDAVTAVTAFRSCVEEALTTTLPSLNKQWDNAQSDYDTAVRTANTAYQTATDPAAAPTDSAKDDARSDRTLAVLTATGVRDGREVWLTGQFEVMRTELRTAATTCGSALSGASPITFSDSQWTAVRGGHLTLADLASLRSQVFGPSSVLHLSDVFRTAEDVRSRLAAGESPASVLGGMDQDLLSEIVQRGLVDDSAVAAAFADDPEVQKVLALVQRLTTDPFPGNSGGSLDVLSDLSPVQRQALLATLSDDQLKVLWAYCTTPSAFDPNPAFQRSDLETVLLGTASPRTVTRLVSLFDLNPALDKNTHYGTPAGPFSRGNELVYDRLTDQWLPVSAGKSWTDVNQGGVGDCWFMSALAAMGHDRGDGFYDELTHQNLNGTVAVRLYDTYGRAHTVTVDGQIPIDDAAYKIHGARGDDTTDAGESETWPAYVEKALAHVRDGSNSYASIDGDTSQTAMQFLTGQGTHDVDDGGSWFFNVGASDSERLANMKRELDEHHSVFVSTKGDSDDYTLLGGRVVANHLYFVREILPDGRIVLFNPWGLSADPPSVTLTPAELNEISDGMTATDDG